MVAEIFNILGFHIPRKEHDKDAKQNGLIVPSHSIDDDAQRWGSNEYSIHGDTQDKTEEDKAKETEYAALTREEYLSSLCYTLTPQDTRLLVHAEDELAQTKVQLPVTIFLFILCFTSDVFKNLANFGNTPVFTVPGSGALFWKADG